jgi:hypothetical protein
MPDRPIVKIKCEVPGGLRLRVFEALKDPFGVLYQQQVGEPVEIRPGINDLDAEFFQLWLKQNHDADVVKSQLVREVQL